MVFWFHKKRETGEEFTSSAYLLTSKDRECTVGLEYCILCITVDTNTHTYVPMLTLVSMTSDKRLRLGGARSTVHWKGSRSSQGLLDRWTSQLDLGCTTGGVTFNLNNGTKSHLIIVKLLENTFLGMTKVRDWPILTLAMLSVKTEQIQNFALFWDCCRRPKSVISGNLSKNTHVWATQWTTSSELKVKFDPSLDRS